MWFFLNLYLQQVLGLSAFPSGSALLPMTVLIMAGMVLVAPRVIAAVTLRLPKPQPEMAVADTEAVAA
jgi:hypothetical protein